MYRLLVIAYFITTSTLDVGESKCLNRRSLFNGRIIGGQTAKIEDYPYQVAVEYQENYRCGAAIISDSWILTAAHCVDGLQPSKVQIRAASSLRSSGGSVHNSSEIIVHPAYDKYNFDSDIAIIKVSPPLDYVASVKAIPLIDSEPSTGEVATVTGWGPTIPQGLLSFELEVVSVPIVDREICNNDYSAYGGITPNMICAGFDEGGKDACNGDTGSSLVVRGTLAGIVSWGIDCADAGYPGVYANIAQLKEFIYNNTDIV